jgi:hypothetical protein
MEQRWDGRQWGNEVDKCATGYRCFANGISLNAIHRSHKKLNVATKRAKEIRKEKGTNTYCLKIKSTRNIIRYLRNKST